MKYVIVILLLLGSYIGGRTHSYREVVTCADQVVKEANPKSVIDFYGHITYDRNHHAAYAYYKTLHCILGRMR